MIASKTVCRRRHISTRSTCGREFSPPSYRSQILIVSSLASALCCLSNSLLANAAQNNRYQHQMGRRQAQQRRRATMADLAMGRDLPVEPEYSPNLALAMDTGTPKRQRAASAVDIMGNTRSLQSTGTTGRDDVIEGSSTSVSPAAKLRADLLANYDRGSFPWEYAWSLPQSTSTQDDASTNTSIRGGLPVEVGINFHRVHAVSVKDGTADIIVWFRLRWTDPRLAWDPLDYDNVTETWFWIGEGGGSAGEMSEIWTPDLQLWNMEMGLEDSLSDTYAKVSNDGLVFWSRPGHLIPACRFSGLEHFPFDTLSCTMEFGSWSYSGLYVRPTKLDGVGYSIGGSETAGQSYAEIRFPESKGDEAISAREHVYPPYIGAPEEDWPVVFYDVKFIRSWQPYARGYVLLQVILNFAGFAAFWLPVACGERMSLTITALLAAVASELVVTNSLPTASEMTWFQQFSIFSLVFAALALFESVAVIFFFYQMNENLKPNWYVYLKKQWAERGKDGVKTRRSFSSEEDNAEGAFEGECAPSNSEMYEEEARPTLEAAHVPRDAEDYADEDAMKHNAYWKVVSHKIDEASRVVFPFTYIVTLSVLLAQVDYVS